MEKYIDVCLKRAFFVNYKSFIWWNVKKKKWPKVSTWCFLEQREKHPANNLGFSQVKFIYIAHFIQQAWSQSA